MRARLIDSSATTGTSPEGRITGRRSVPGSACLAAGAAALALGAATAPAASAGVNSAGFQQVTGQPFSAFDFRSGGRNDLAVIDAPTGEQNTYRITDRLGQGWASLVGCRALSDMSAICGGSQLPPVGGVLFVLSGDDDRFRNELRGPLPSPNVPQWLGGRGNDSFVTGGGGRLTQDVYDGQIGFDTLSYAGRPGGIEVNGPRTSGGEPAIGERDTVQDVEVVIGSDHADDIRPDGEAHPFQQYGRAGNDTLRGSELVNNRPLDGGTGVDVLIGDGDSTTRGGQDLLVGREPAGATVSEPDRLFCGPGDDEAIMDLQDRSSGCETRRIAAIDEGGILRIRGADLRRHGREAHVRLGCPRTSKTPCAGRLTIRRGARVLASGRYGLRRGRKQTVVVAMARAAARPVLVRARERDSRGRPKISEATLRLR